MVEILNQRYQLDERIGTGGMAMVFRANDLMLERTVAIKTMRKDYSDDPDFRNQFRQEAKAAAKLAHPNIVTVHDFGLDYEILYIVMEYVPGKDLKSVIKDQGMFSPEESIHLIKQACSGIGYAHRAGLVHCDIKPQNMIITPEKRVKVADFGIARAITTINPDSHEDVVWGSPYYFSPEQASGLPPSPASDVYSLGVILYEMTTGRLPFDANNSRDLARQHLNAKPLPPRGLNPQIPADLESIILTCLAKNPADRFNSAGEMGRAVIRANEGLSIRSNSTDFSSKLPASPMPETLSTTTASQYNQAGGTDISPDVSSSNPGLLENMTWVNWLLVVITLLFVGGLIPFWLWIYFALN
jgi:serine/threonine-protein kinase